MKFTVNTKEFVEAVKSAGKALGKGVTNVVLAGLHVKASEVGVSVRCFDLETDISIWVTAFGIEEGEILIGDAKTLLKNIAKLPAKSDITIEGQDADTSNFYGKLTCENTAITLRLMPTKNYPVERDFKGQEHWHINTTARALREPLARVLVAAARVDKYASRAYLEGVLFESTAEGVFLTASDGFRLATDKLEGGSAGKQDAKAILPSSLLAPLLARLAKMPSDACIAMTIGSRIVEIEMDAAVYSGRVLEGSFPDYHKIIPDTRLWRAQVSADVLLPAVLRVKQIVRDELSAIRYEVVDNNLVLKGSMPEMGEATETVVLDLFEGEAPSVSLRAVYVAEVLKAIGGAKVIIEGQTNRSPVMFTIEGNNNYKYMVIPING